MRQVAKANVKTVNHCGGAASKHPVGVHLRETTYDMKRSLWDGQIVPVVRSCVEAFCRAKDFASARSMLQPACVGRTAGDQATSLALGSFKR